MNDVVELATADGFGHVAIEALLCQSFLLVRQGMRSQRNDRGPVIAGIHLPQPCSGFHPVHAGHLKVHEDQVEGFLSGLAQGFKAAGSALGVQLAVFQQGHYQLQVGIVIVHGQHSRHIGGRCTVGGNLVLGDPPAGIDAVHQQQKLIVQGISAHRFGEVAAGKSR